MENKTNKTNNKTNRKPNIKTNKLPLIGITMGDPVGIGPEIIIDALAEPSIYERCRPIVLGDIKVMKKVAKLLKKKVLFNEVQHIDNSLFKFGKIDILSLSHLDGDIVAGKSTIDTSRAMLDYITTAIDMAKKNEIHAMVTCPINKYAMQLSQSEFSGHTELLAKRTDTKRYVMMMAGKKLNVVLVTIHMSLKDSIKAITQEKIRQTIDITEKALRERFLIPKPRIAVAGLNPHAGEEGLFGNEENLIITPCVEKAKADGLDITGPYPADTLFYYAAKGNWDVVVCMYHDQGLIPFKLLHFEDGVNITLGLPIIRTSVDHGTAYDIAWQGKASSKSLVAAIDMATFQASNAKAV